MPANRVDFKYVREHASFEKVASHYGIKLTGKGDQRSALCTFHDEDTPSLKINVAKNIFHCFGCGKKGNVLDFVTFMEGGDPNVDRDLRAGAFALAEMCGIDPLPTSSARARPEPREDRPRAKVRKREEAPEPQTAPDPPPKALRGNKPLSFTLKLDPAHPYLAERELSTSDIETFGLGMADRGLMKGRLAIPIHNERGDLIAYAGRWGSKEVPKGTPKYLLPEGFEKQSVLFNLHRLPEQTETVILVESYFSVIRLHGGGRAVVSPMGHSVSEEQSTLLARRSVKQVIVLFDGDEAGAQGVAESLPLLARHFFVHVPAVPTGFKPHRATQTDLDAILAGQQEEEPPSVRAVFYGDPLGSQKNGGRAQRALHQKDKKLECHSQLGVAHCSVRLDAIQGPSRELADWPMAFTRPPGAPVWFPEIATRVPADAQCRVFFAE